MAAMLGLDIGGANLKFAHSDGVARNKRFPLWEEANRLASVLGRLLPKMPPAEGIAVTMTGELCDYYRDKRTGVLAILDAVEEAAGKTPLRVWSNKGRFVDVQTARQSPLPIASANWLALATFVGRFAPRGPALLIDIGSTTSDIVPLLDGRPIPKTRTDPERLRTKELVYTGVRRTPLCSLLPGYGAAEVFATTQDIYALLGHLPFDLLDVDTADERPLTRSLCETRIARMLCGDLETTTPEERKKLLYLAFNYQQCLLSDAILQVAARLPALPQTVVFAGEGEFLIHLVLEDQDEIPPCRVVSLRKQLGERVSRAACAYAVAMLAAEEWK